MELYAQCTIVKPTISFITLIIMVDCTKYYVLCVPIFELRAICPEPRSRRISWYSRLYFCIYISRPILTRVSLLFCILRTELSRKHQDSEMFGVIAGNAVVGSSSKLVRKSNTNLEPFFSVYTL